MCQVPGRRYRVLPEFLANVSRRFSTPVAASILIVGLTWVYLLTTSVQNAFNDVVAVTGLLLMLIARFGLRSSFFQTRRESERS